MRRGMRREKLQSRVRGMFKRRESANITVANITVVVVVTVGEGVMHLLHTTHALIHTYTCILYSDVLA